MDSPQRPQQVVHAYTVDGGGDAVRERDTPRAPPQHSHCPVLRQSHPLQRGSLPVSLSRHHTRSVGPSVESASGHRFRLGDQRWQRVHRTTRGSFGVFDDPRQPAWRETDIRSTGLVRHVQPVGRWLLPARKGSSHCPVRSPVLRGFQFVLMSHSYPNGSSTSSPPG